MKLLLKNGVIFFHGEFVKRDILINNEIIEKVEDKILDKADTVMDLENKHVFPGLIDVHTHLREPGFEYKETIKTGTMAAARGGFTSICAMPNLKPVPDSIENLQVELDAIQKDAKVKVYPYGAITEGESGKRLSSMDEISDKIIAFSDDGKGVQSEDMMKEAMTKAKKLDKIIAAHCEVDSLLNGGYIHDGEYAKKHNHRGISSESEWKEIERDVELAKITGAKYHVCHVSTKESVDIIRNAKKNGIDVTCETAPHYLVLTDMDLQEDGFFKMNPPLRSKIDQQALIDGINDGTIDMIITDHAPHSLEEKSRGLEKSAMGIIGLETSFPLIYTYLVKKKIISLEKAIELMNVNPGKRFNIGTKIEVGEKADLSVFDLSEKYIIDSSKFASKGRNTPFNGYSVYGKCKATIVNGEIVYKE